jgi:hypothetical protein
MDLSLVLAKILGLYCLIVSISILLNYQRIPVLVHEFVESEGLKYIAGLISLILGIIVIIIHPIISYDWRLIITLFGWGAFLYGLVNLFIPELALQIIRLIGSYRKIFSIFAFAVFLFSLILLAEGFNIPFMKALIPI